MPRVSDATEAEMENGGRTFEEIMEDMKEESKRNPGVVKKTVNMAVAQTKQNAISAFRSYVGQVGDVIDELGLSDEERDAALADVVGDMVNELGENTADVAVNGLSVEEKLANAETPQTDAPAASHGTYVPEGDSAVNMWEQQTQARNSGAAIKSLQYTDEQLLGMSPENMKQAASLGMVSPDKLAEMGMDTSELTRNAGMNFGMQKTQKVIHVDKIKQMPEYMPGFREGGDNLGIVTGADDMVHQGDDEIFTSDPMKYMKENAGKPADVLKKVAEVGASVAEGDVAGLAEAASEVLSGSALKSAARGAMADHELHTEAIQAEEQRQRESAFFGDDGLNM